MTSSRTSWPSYVSYYKSHPPAVPLFVTCHVPITHDQTHSTWTIHLSKHESPYAYSSHRLLCGLHILHIHQQQRLNQCAPSDLVVRDISQHGAGVVLLQSLWIGAFILFYALIYHRALWRCGPCLSLSPFVEDVSSISNLKNKVSVTAFGSVFRMTIGSDQSQNVKRMTGF